MRKILPLILCFFLIANILQGQNIDSVSCKANFSWKVNDKIMFFAPGMAINFTDLSFPDAVSWVWDFGDGTYSKEQNPLHMYTLLYQPDGSAMENGIFHPTVCLTIATADGCTSNICKTLNFNSDTVIMPKPPCYVFFYPYRNDTLLTIPEVIPYSFKVSAPENTITYHWNFGDGQTSTEANPVHTYNFLGGAFDVCLTITTSDSCTNTYCATLFVGPGDSTVVPDCQAGFTYSVMESWPLQFAFLDESTGDPAAWFWDFGDGQFSTEQNPVHIFGSRRDSFNYMEGTPYNKKGYKVCLTTRNESNCTSTYCDFVYPGGPVDTIFPVPCPYYINITTSSILGSGVCNGSATATLVNGSGMPVEVSDIFWSTGENEPGINGLCVNVPYYVSLTAEDGCQVAGSFALIDYTQPGTSVGYWSIYGNGSSYQMNYSLPDSGYVCYWEFSDGTVEVGNQVNYMPSGDEDRTVKVTVMDAEGNVVYVEHIALNGALEIKSPHASTAKLYPNPAEDRINIRFEQPLDNAVNVELFNAVGLCLNRLQFNNISGQLFITIPVADLPKGIYFARIMQAMKKPVTMRFSK